MILRIGVGGCCEVSRCGGVMVSGLGLLPDILHLNFPEEFVKVKASKVKPSMTSIQLHNFPAERVERLGRFW